MFLLFGSEQFFCIYIVLVPFLYYFYSASAILKFLSSFEFLLEK